MLMRMQRNEIAYTLLIGIESDTAPVENTLAFLKNLNMQLPSSPAVALVTIYPKEVKT